MLKPHDHNKSPIFSWDTKSPKEPIVKFEAHEKEILSVAFALANEHLIVTGSADKVGTFYHTNGADFSKSDLNRL